MASGDVTYITRPSLKQKISFVPAGNTRLLVYAVAEQVKAKKGHRTLSNITPPWSSVCVCEAMMSLHKTDEASVRKDTRLHGLPLLEQNNPSKSYAASPAHFFFSLLYAFTCVHARLFVLLFLCKTVFLLLQQAHVSSQIHKICLGCCILCNHFHSNLRRSQ